ncbi:MAG: MBL fold metallo-hydrolase [Desulfuromonadales bacterium]|nr:MBL fold metallo-hydrolase [Desulfuromonadales bacterium]
MQNLGLFRYLQPSFFSGVLDDPVMFINIRPTGRGILLDCGQLHHLAKRVLRSIDALFISHAHMDHLMGFDHLLRHVHVAPRTIAVYGPSGIADRISHKLAGYDWNLTEETWCTIMVYEVQPRQVERFEFAGSRGFTSRYRQTIPRHDRTIYQSRHLKVEAEICDHKIPVLIFRVTEARSFLLDRQRMLAENLLPGPWLKDLEKRFYADSLNTGPIEIWKDSGGEHTVETVDNAEKLYQKICRDVPPASIGYLSDVGMTSENLSRICDLMNGVTLLVSECTFLAEDEEKARISSHLCTTDLNRISRQIEPDFLLPMHLSKSYISDTQRLYAELNPPRSTQFLQLPDYMTPRPLLPDELPSLIPGSHS